MSERNLFYELSSEADRDIVDIYNYTAQKFGFKQAITYVAKFDESFELLLDNPELGVSRKEIRVGLRCLVHVNHVIFYRVMVDRIRIVRVLHSRRDIDV